MITQAMSLIAALLPSPSAHSEAPIVRCDIKMERWCLTPFSSDIQISKQGGLFHWRMGTSNDGFTWSESVNCREKYDGSWSLYIPESNTNSISKYVMQSGLCTITIDIASTGESMRSYLRYVENGILFYSGSEYVTIGELKRPS